MANVALLGSDEKLDWTQGADALVIKHPARLPSDHAIAFKLTFAN